KVPVVYQPDQKLEIGKAVEIIEGSDVTLIATGLLVAEAIRAAEMLESEGISARVLDFPTIKPLDREAIAKASAETRAIVVAEEQLVDAGLGVRVAQAAAESKPCPMEFVGLTGYAESGTPEDETQNWTSRSRNAIAGESALRREWINDSLFGVMCYPLHSPDSTAVYAGGYALDITAVGTAEKELRATTLRILKAQESDRG